MQKKALLIRVLLAISAIGATTCQSLNKVADVADIILDSAEMLDKGRIAAYKEDPRQLIQDFRRVQRNYLRLVNALRGNVSKKWGKDEVKIPSQKQYVKYTQNYLSRATVGFDTGVITIETLDEKNPPVSMKNAIVTTLLTPDDPQSVDLFSDKQVRLSSERKPYLYGLVVDQNNQPINSPESAETFAEHLLKYQMKARQIQVGDQEKKAVFVKFGMVSNFEDKQAEMYEPIVATYAEKYQTSKSLVLAMIKTESNFNPFAVSPAPAYGLMQLVPTSGGRTGYRKAKGRDSIPSKDLLFDPKTNIELGTAYLNVLAYNQLNDIADLTSREYCVISAYNTGPRNVLNTFSKDLDSAFETINQMTPPDVYAKLIRELPYNETRQYLPAVIQHRKAYVRF